MSKRKRPSLETKLAAMTVLFFDIPYLDAKKMTPQQVNSLVQWDHNILHETGHPDRDRLWNLTPRLIREHREKTKRDAKIIAKSRRLRAAWENAPLGAGNQAMLAMADAVSAGIREGVRESYDRISRKPNKFSEGWNRVFDKHKRKIESRGFDKTKRRKMDGTVEKRK